MIAAESFYFRSDAEHVDRFLQMSSGDHHGVRAHLDQFLTGCFHRGEVLHFHARQKFRFRQVRRDYADALQQFIAHKFQAGSVQQFRVPGGRTENGIEHDVCELVFVEKFGDRRSIAAICKHAYFHARNHYVIHQRVELRSQSSRGRCVHRYHALRGLHCERSDCRHTIAIMRGKRLQISSYARSAGRIESGNGEKNRWSRSRVVIQFLISLAQVSQTNMPAPPFFA